MQSLTLLCWFFGVVGGCLVGTFWIAPNVERILQKAEQTPQPKPEPIRPARAAAILNLFSVFAYTLALSVVCIGPPVTAMPEFLRGVCVTILFLRIVQALRDLYQNPKG